MRKKPDWYKVSSFVSFFLTPFLLSPGALTIDTNFPHSLFSCELRKWCLLNHWDFKRHKWGVKSASLIPVLPLTHHINIWRVTWPLCNNSVTVGNGTLISPYSLHGVNRISLAIKHLISLYLCQWFFSIGCPVMKKSAEPQLITAELQWFGALGTLSNMPKVCWNRGK